MDTYFKPHTWKMYDKLFNATLVNEFYTDDDLDFEDWEGAEDKVTPVTPTTPPNASTSTLDAHQTTPTQRSVTPVNAPPVTKTGDPSARTPVGVPS